MSLPFRERIGVFSVDPGKAPDISKRYRQKLKLQGKVPISLDVSRQATLGD